MPTIWLLRHGKAGDLLGDYDRLSETGFAQARLTGAAYRHLAPLHRLVSGTMRRQRETAGAFAEAFGPTPHPEEDARWNEYDHMSIIQSAIQAGIQPQTRNDGTGFSSFFGDAMGRWASGDHDADYSERYTDFQHRAVTALTELAESLGSGQTAVVATSGGVISTVCQHLLGLSAEQSFRLNTIIVNGSMTRIRVGGGRMSVTGLNQDLHLETADGMLTHV